MPELAPVTSAAFPSSFKSKRFSPSSSP
jgi:hypothetical protein